MCCCAHQSRLIRFLLTTLALKTISVPALMLAAGLAADWVS
jgi:hypothetical protein